MWEEMVHEQDPSWGQVTIWRRRMATVDRWGHVKMQPFSLKCWDSRLETESGGDEDPGGIEPYFCDRDYCKLFNLAIQPDKDVNPEGLAAVGVYHWVELPYSIPSLSQEDVDRFASETFQVIPKSLDGLSSRELHNFALDSNSGDRLIPERANGPTPLEALPRPFRHEDGDGDPRNDYYYAYVHAGWWWDEGGDQTPYVVFFGTVPDTEFVCRDGKKRNAVFGLRLWSAPQGMPQYETGGLSVSKKTVTALMANDDAATGRWNLYFSTVGLP